MYMRQLFLQLGISLLSMLMRNTYRETASTQTVEFKRLLVELTKVEEVDPYAGFFERR